MNPQDPLAQLNPLREPTAIGWWPPAPGWWVVAGLLVLLVIVTLYLAYRHHRRRRYRRQANRQLNTLFQHWQSSGDDPRFFSETNALLKATALQSFSHSQVASLSGERWTAFLTDTAPRIAAPPSLLGNQLYYPQPQGDPQALFDFARGWIRYHRRPS